MHPRKSCVYTRAIPNQTPTTTKREDCNIVRVWLISLYNSGGQSGFLKCYINHIMHCEFLWKWPALHLQDKPCKPLLAVHHAVAAVRTTKEAKHWARPHSLSTWSASRNIISQFHSSHLARKHHQIRLHSLYKFVNVRYVNSRKNGFHQLAHRGKEIRQGDISSLLQPSKLTGNPVRSVYTHHLLTIDTLVIGRFVDTLVGVTSKPAKQQRRL